MEEKEKRIRAITAFYYSNPDVQKAIVKFSADREVVPRYFEGFGKRPDMIQYFSDVNGLVKKGATSFHASEELWNDPLQLDSEMNQREMTDLRKGWDLLIDIDSPFLDCSRIAAKLIIEELEAQGVKNYGIKFSGSKGFHLIVPDKAFPKEVDGVLTREMFPEWPRAICEFITEKIRPLYNKEIGKMEINFSALETRTKMKKEDLEEVTCPVCNRPGKKGVIVKFVCPACGDFHERKDVKITKRRRKCLNDRCAGVLEVAEQKDYFFCEYCDKSSWDKSVVGARGSVTHSQKIEEAEQFDEGISGNKMASMDLILVAPRHLFRMPYSLHEKTALVSAVLEKDEIDSFSPKDADPMKVKVKEFMPESVEGEAERLLRRAIVWKKARVGEEEKMEGKKYAGKKFSGKGFEELDIKNVDESLYPKPIKKLLKGLNEGRKRGLFVLITFLRSINLTPEELNKRIREWNEKNDPPLKEGYIRSQIDWHIKQRKRILPPNYANESFYRDIGILEKKPTTKNPLVDVMREIRKRK